MCHTQPFVGYIKLYLISVVIFSAKKVLDVELICRRLLNNVAPVIPRPEEERLVTECASGCIVMIRRRCFDRFDFQREVSTLRCLNDPNIVRLLGVVSGGMRQGDVAPCIVTEYMLFGDLKQFLQRHQALEGTISRAASSTMARVNSLRFVAHTCSQCVVESQSRWTHLFFFAVFPCFFAAPADYA